MGRTVRDVMQGDPLMMAADVSTLDAALSLRSTGKECILVEKDDCFYGIATVKDLVDNILAQRKDAKTTQLLHTCSRVVVTLSPADSVGDAVSLMRQQARRLIPVVENGRAVGIVTFMDLAAYKTR
jgi:CBS domain-containing protein